MTSETASPLAKMLHDSRSEILDEWINQQLSDPERSRSVPETTIRSSSEEFIRLFEQGTETGNHTDLSKPEWKDLQSMLTELSTSRAVQGSTPTETAKFIFSLKQPLFARLNARAGQTDANLIKQIGELSTLLDKLGLHTSEAYQQSREAIIRRQQREMMEMSTPVIKLWEGVLAVPLIGTLDSARTQIVMEALLQRIVETGSKVAILDITGVPTVDTQTAQHLMKTVAATRLMGADCIISGIRPQIAQTIVHLGIDIHDITTKATMADAIKEALTQGGWKVERKFEKATN